MDDRARSNLGEYMLGLADDELILGHRDSEWCGVAPIIEEDIAFANIALDEIGHAQLWYGLLADLNGEDKATYPDRIVFERDPKDFRNIQMVELPKGDWAFSILRQYLFDEAELLRLDSLKESQYGPLAEVAAKIRTEELYHQRHDRLWVKRLALGTAESRRRLQTALDSLWPYCAQLFSADGSYADLVRDGNAPEQRSLETAWEAQVTSFLQGCEMTIPQAGKLSVDRRTHSPHLKPLTSEMQSVRRLDPLAEW